MVHALLQVRKNLLRELPITCKTSALISVIFCLTSVNLARTKGWSLDRVRTHAGHSIVFSTFLHFVTLWPWPLTFRPKSHIISRISHYWVWRLSDHSFFELCCGQSDRNTHRQTPMNALLSRLSSAWVIKSYHHRLTLLFWICYNIILRVVDWQHTVRTHRLLPT